MYKGRKITKIFRILFSETLNKKQLAFGCALISVIIAGLWFVYSGYPSPDHGYWPDHPDRAIWMDASWRIIQGQIPHRDFISPIGSAWLYINAIPFWILGLSYSVIPLAAAISMTLLSLGIFPLMYMRSKSWLAALLAVWVMIALNINSISLDYNSIALSLLVFVWLDAISVPENSWRNWAWVSGGIISILLFWKLNYAVFSLVLTILSIVMFKKNRYWFNSLILGFIFMTVVLISGIRGHIDLMIQNIQIPFMVKEIHITFVSFWAAIKSQWGYTLLMGICFITAWKSASPRWPWLRPSFVGLGIVIGLILIQSVLCLTNASKWQAHAVPFMGLAAVIWLAGDCNCFYLKPSKMNIVIMATVIAVMTTYSLTQIIQENETKCRARNIHQTSLVDQPMNYFSSVSDGLRLLNQQKEKGQRVLCMEYSNPFPSLLRWTSVKKDLLWWNHLDSFNKVHHPDIHSILYSTDLIMQPKWFVDDFRRDVYEQKWQLFESDIVADFQVLAESTYWKIWGRRKINYDKQR